MVIFLGRRHPRARWSAQFRLLLIFLVGSALFWLPHIAYAQVCLPSGQVEVPFQSINNTAPATTINSNISMKVGNSRVQLALQTFGNFAINTNGISDSHFTGEAGIRLGHASGNGTSFANRLEATVSFVDPNNIATPKPVKGLSFRLHDIDAGDVVVVNAYDQNNNLITMTAANYTLYAGTYVTFAGGNSFTSSAADAPSNTRLGTVDINLSAVQVSRIVIQYWDVNSAGTYTIAEMTACSEAQLVTTKTLASGNTTPIVGETVTYQVQVTNNGPLQATNVSLTDLLPTGLTATGSNGTVSQGSYNSSSGLWTVGTLNNGATATLTLSGTVNAGTGGTTITNTTTAAATSDQSDPSTAGDDLTESVTVAAPLGTMTPAAPASPAICSISGSWKQIMLNNALSGSNGNGVTAAGVASGPVSYIGNDPQPLVFDSSEYMMGSTPLPLAASRFTINSPVTLNTMPGTVTWNFLQTPTREIRLHYNSVDNIRLIFSQAANPDIGWTSLSYVRANNFVGGANFSIGDDDVSSRDANFTDAYADGTSGGLSADGTIRFYSISGNPITQLNLGWIDQTGVEALDIGFLALEACGFRPIVADDDSVSGINGATGGNDVLNVLDGDTLSGAAAAASNVTVSVTTPATPINGGPVPILGTDGLVDVPSGTLSGTYGIEYKICETANALNCDTGIATIVVPPYADFAIAKTNNTSIVTSGATTTYVLTVTNNGPDTITGALIKDAPGAGLTCPAGNAVTIAGSGVPAGSFTVADLTGAGIALGTLAMGQSTTLTYTCQVN